MVTKQTWLRSVLFEGLSFDLPASRSFISANCCWRSCFSLCFTTSDSWPRNSQLEIKPANEVLNNMTFARANYSPWLNIENPAKKDVCLTTLELTPLKSGRFRASPSAHWPWASEKRQGGSSRSHWPNWTNSCAPTQIESSGESVGLCYPQVLGPLGRLFHSSVAEALDEPREVRSPWTQPKGPSALLGT